MLDSGTGVATYARALLQAQRHIDPESMVLRETAPSSSISSRPYRWARALLPFATTVSATGNRLAEDGAMLRAGELFRLAQVFFDVHRRLLNVRVPGPPGIMHWSYPLPLRIAGWINVYTIHDVIPLSQSGLSPVDSGRHRRLLLKIAASADKIVTVSRAARDAIVDALGCPGPFIVDCSQTVDATQPPPGTLPAGLTSGNFLLICGSVEPRKNIAAAILAYRQSRVAIPLVIAGPNGWRAGELAPLIQDSVGVIRLEYCDTQAMRRLIANARALLMPSLAEGFGLPVAEAMALGTPVMTSDGGALAETAGDAALLVDPHDVGQMAAAIHHLVTDAALRSRLVVAGSENAARFSPENFTRRLSDLYSGLVAAQAAAG